MKKVDKSLDSYWFLQPIPGNLCSTAAADNGMFRQELCCKACKELRSCVFFSRHPLAKKKILNTLFIFTVGGEPGKDSSYIYTAPGLVCADATNAATLCNVRYLSIYRFYAGSITYRTFQTLKANSALHAQTCPTATGRIYCKNTCGYCDIVTQSNIITTIPGWLW